MPIQKEALLDAGGIGVVWTLKWEQKAKDWSTTPFYSPTRRKVSRSSTDVVKEHRSECITRNRSTQKYILWFIETWRCLPSFFIGQTEAIETKHDTACSFCVAVCRRPVQYASVCYNVQSCTHWWEMVLHHSCEPNSVCNPKREVGEPCAKSSCQKQAPYWKGHFPPCGCPSAQELPSSPPIQWEDRNLALSAASTHTTHV